MCQQVKKEMKQNAGISSKNVSWGIQHTVNKMEVLFLSFWNKYNCEYSMGKIQRAYLDPLGKELDVLEPQNSSRVAMFGYVEL